MRIWLALLVPVCALAACTPPLEYSPTPDPDACQASSLQRLIGQPLAAFDQGVAVGPVRIIGPDTPVTMDYFENRLNISHDGRWIITRIACG